MSKDHSNKQEGSHNRNELRQVQENLHMMRNRVHLLRSQLQKEKESIQKHKSMTEDMVRRKVEFSKLAALRNRDTREIDQEISQLRQRNHSFREIHKKEMDNILKAVYLVKLDEARQMKSLSQHNKSIIQQREQSLRAKHREKRRDMMVQSQNAKQRYLEYWKNKLNSIYSASQQDRMEMEAEAEQKKRQLMKYQQQQIQLLEAMNKLHHERTDAKKEYLASLTLSSKEIEQAFEHRDDPKESKSKQKGPMSPRRMQELKEREKEKSWQEKVEKLGGSRVEQRYKDHKERDQEFWSKSPHISIMSSHDLRMPRASVDPAKLKIILKQLKRLEAQQKK